MSRVNAVASTENRVGSIGFGVKSWRASSAATDVAAGVAAQVDDEAAVGQERDQPDELFDEGVRRRLSKA